MQLDARLKSVAGFVTAGSRVADIGTDHAYLAIAMIQSGRASFVMASDKNSGPYEAAKRAVKEAGLTQKIDVRLGDGLSVLAAGEVDTICMAGMGGQLMCEILAAYPSILARTDTLVLQPMGAATELRSWLYEHHWYIADETLALADGRIYEIIQAQPGQRKKPEAMLLEIGPVLWQNKPTLLRYHIEQLLFQARRAAAGMEKSERAKKSLKYKKIMQHIKGLEDKLKW